MKCPLLTIALSAVAAKSVVHYPECLKADCAWWDLEGEECIIHSLGAIAGNLQHWGKALRDELHTANQGRGYLRD